MEPWFADAPSQAVALPRAGLQARIAPLRERTAKLVPYLAKELGPDVWLGGEVQPAGALDLR